MPLLLLLLLLNVTFNEAFLAFKSNYMVSNYGKSTILYNKNMNDDIIDISSSTIDVKEDNESIIHDLKSKILKIGVLSNRGDLQYENNDMNMKEEAKKLAGELEDISKNDVNCNNLKGEWSLVYTSSSFLFMSSPFFQAARHVCKTEEEVDRFKWFCRQHRDALAFTSIGNVKQIITDTTITSEFESNVAAIPGLPIVIKGTIESTADVDFENNVMNMKMDTVRIKRGTSNIPIISNLLDEFDGLQTRILSDLLENNVNTYKTPLPKIRTYYCDDSFRISRDVDDDIYVYVKN